MACEVQRCLAAMLQGCMAAAGWSGADEQGFAGGFDDLWGHGVEVVDLSDALDLGQKAVCKAEAAAGDVPPGT